MLALNALYYHRRYRFPKYGKWEEWYAWHPVEVMSWSSTHFPVKVSNKVWLKDVVRRSVWDRDSIISKDMHYYEYITMYDLLRYEGVMLSQL